MCESIFKLLIIGDSGVGKTAMVGRYCYSKWMPNLKVTLGVDYAVKSINWSKTETVKLLIWDIGGQENFRAMTRAYYRGASGCVIMFDITDKTSFEHAKDWKDDLDAKVALPNGETIPCILLANKDDLPDKVVTSHEISKFAKENNFIYWSFISVKENRNIPEAMNQLVRQMLQQEHDPQQVEVLPQLRLEISEQESSPSGCCNYNTAKKV